MNRNRLKPALVVSVVVAVATTGRVKAQTRTPKDVIDRIVRAYPSSTAIKNGKLQVQGKPVDTGTGLSEGTFDGRMAKANLIDQLSIEYPRGCPLAQPAEGEDPGRLRSDAFFRSMYGGSPVAVKKNLVSVDWFGSPMQVTSINGVDEELKQVAAELNDRPELQKYLERPGGSFTWRPIAGTKVQSAHSFGIAVDINTKFSDYWRWKDTTKVGPYVNRIPCEIAEVFENHGFIWGAKWWHFDTMHFEYRPELL